MKEEMIKTVVYEVGDIVDVSRLRRTQHKNSGMFNAQYGLIIDVKSTATNGSSYWIITDKKNKTRIPFEESKNLKYISHLDMTPFEALCVPEYTFEEQDELGLVR